MIAKYTPAAPITAKTGDTFPEIAGSFVTADGWHAPIKGFTHKRGAATLATYLLKDMTRVPLTTGVFLNSSTLPFAFYVEEFKMDAATATNTAVTKNGDNFNFDFAGTGTPRTLEQLAAEQAELQTDEMAQKFQRVMAFARSSGGANMTSQVGKVCTIDFNADNPVSFS